METIEQVRIKKFITHVAKTSNKFKENKYIKINNNSIYSSNLNRFARNIVMRNLHDYLISSMVENNLNKLTNPPYQVSLIIYAPINYGDVRRLHRKGEPYLAWNPPKSDYIPTWDIGNLGEIWLKAFEDALQLGGYIENDTIKYISSHGPITFKPVSSLEERTLIFKIQQLNL